MNKCSRSDPAPKEPQNAVVQKVSKTTYKVQQQEVDSSGDESEPTVHAMSAPVQKPLNPPSGLKFPCPMANHKHEISTCSEFLHLVLWNAG